MNETKITDDLYFPLTLEGGGGSSITVEPLSVTENGVYTAQSGKAYSPVSVSVTPDLTTKSITENGTYNASADNADGYSSVTVNVSNEVDMTVTANQVKLLVDITDNDLLTVNVGYYQSVSEGVEVDFGEGEVQKSTQTGATFPYTYAYVTHTYSTQGQKLITLTCKSGTLTLIGDNIDGAGIIVYDPTISVENGYIQALMEKTRTVIREIAIGDNIICTSDCLNRIPFLCKTNKYGYGTLHFSFTDNYGLTEIIIPNGVTTIRSYGLSTIYGVKYITLPNGLTDISAEAFTNCKTLTNINIPSTVISIGQRAFTNCFGVIVDFTDIELVEGALPITFGINVFGGVLSQYGKLIFATQEIAEVAKQTTNLTAYASLIHYVGE